MIKNEVKTLPARDLWSLLDRTRFAVARLRELELAHYGLTIEQASILHILTRQGGSSTAKELEDVTMRRQHSVSALLNGMVKMGLVSKVRNPGEKKFQISITPAGETLYNKVTISSLEKTFSSLESADRDQLVDCLYPLLERGRYLLGIPYKPPILQYLDNGNSRKASRENEDIKESFYGRTLWTLLERTVFAISRLRELELAQFGLTIEQASILYFLILRDGSTTMKVLENVTMRQHHSISVLLNGMVKTGLVNKVKNPGEHRFIINLTPEGENLYQKVNDASLEKTFSVLTVRERQRLAACLNPLLERSRNLLGISD
jgi:MarR family transcriptional regulator, 2-MHQ and catechol-resistance regulon repressor